MCVARDKVEVNGAEIGSSDLICYNATGKNRTERDRRIAGDRRTGKIINQAYYHSMYQSTWYKIMVSRYDTMLYFSAMIKYGIFSFWYVAITKHYPMKSVGLSSEIHHQT